MTGYWADPGVTQGDVDAALAYLCGKPYDAKAAIGFELHRAVYAIEHALQWLVWGDEGPPAYRERSWQWSLPRPPAHVPTISAADEHRWRLMIRLSDPADFVILPLAPTNPGGSSA